MATLVKESQPSLATSNWMKVVQDNPVENPPEPTPPPTNPNPPNSPTPAAAPSAPAEPAKPEVATPPTPPPASTEPKSDEKVPRTSAEWKAFKEARDKKYAEYEQKLAEYNKKVAEASKPVVPADYEPLKKQAEEYDKILQQVSVENHPKFKAYYEKAIQTQIGIAKSIVGSDKATEIEKVLSLPDGDYKMEKLQELVADLPPIQQSRIGGVLNQLEAINAEKTSEIQKAKDNFKAMQAQDAEKQAQRRKQFEDTFSKTVEQLKGKDGSPAFQMRENDEEWNKGVEERVEVAKAYLFGNQPPEQLIQAAVNAAAYPAVLKQMMGLMEENGKLQKQIESLSAASPTLNGERRLETTENTTETKRTPPSKPGSRPMDALRDRWLATMPKLGS